MLLMTSLPNQNITNSLLNNASICVIVFLLQLAIRVMRVFSPNRPQFYRMLGHYIHGGYVVMQTARYCELASVWSRSDSVFYFTITETEMDISELEGRVLKELNSSPTPFKGEFDVST